MPRRKKNEENFCFYIRRTWREFLEFFTFYKFFRTKDKASSQCRCGWVGCKDIVAIWERRSFHSRRYIAWKPPQAWTTADYFESKASHSQSNSHSSDCKRRDIDSALLSNAKGRNAQFGELISWQIGNITTSKRGENVFTNFLWAFLRHKTDARIYIEREELHVYIAGFHK